jgi:DNA topoisomerase 2-associated protein PAT1
MIGAYLDSCSNSLDFREDLSIEVISFLCQHTWLFPTARHLQPARAVAVDGDDPWTANNGARSCNVRLTLESLNQSRTSSYPNQPLQHRSSEPILLHRSTSFTSYPPSGESLGLPYPAQGLTRHSSIPSPGAGHLMGSPSSSLSGSPYHMPGLSHGLPYGRNMSYTTGDLSTNNVLQNEWSNQAGPLVFDHLNRRPSFLQPHLSSMSSLLFSQQHQRLAPGQPPLQNYINMQPHLFHHHQLPDVPSPRDKRSRSGRGGKHNIRFSQQPSDAGSQHSESSGIKFRSKYMSSKEIESILKMQHSANQRNDPYFDDYYHQACKAKRSVKPWNK